MTAGKLFILAAAVILLLGTAPTPVRAETGGESITVTTDGEASIEGSNYALARERAIGSALGNAVVVVIKAEGNPLDDADESGALEALNRNASAYISEYRILEEDVDGDTYRVILSATVSAGRIAAVLESGGDLEGRPGTSGNDAILVIIRGVRSYSQYGALKNYLEKEIPCVTEVRERSFQFQLIEFEVQRDRGVVGCLEEALAGSNVAGVSFVIRGSTDSEINLEVPTWSR